MYNFYRVVELFERIRQNAFAFWLECEFGNIHGEPFRRDFKTRNFTVFRADDLEELCGELFQKLLTKKHPEMKGSGLSFVRCCRVFELQVRINVYRPLRGASYVPMPPEIIARWAVVIV